MQNKEYSVSAIPTFHHAAFTSCILLITCFALPPKLFALDPPPGGGYPGQITALGEDALFSQTEDRNVNDTAIGFEALYANTLGVSDTAVGANALHDNT